MKHLENLLTCTDCVSLYCKVLDLLRHSLESHETRGHLKTVSFECRLRCHGNSLILLRFSLESHETRGHLKTVSFECRFCCHGDIYYAV